MPESRYSLTIRARVPAAVGTFGTVVDAVAAVGGQVVSTDIVRSGGGSVTRDYLVSVTGDEAATAVVDAMNALDGVEVEGSTNRELQLHEGGVVGMRNRAALTSRDDLSMAYTPGVARVCMAIHHDFEQTWDYTIKANSVMVVSDGSSVVGLGDLGAEASLPACEAKALFLRELAGIDAFPLPVDARDPEAITEIVALCSSVFAGIHLSDISAPRCGQIQEALDARLDIPVFHDDQQGTAVAVLAGLRNALAVTGGDLATASIAVVGDSPAATATARLLTVAGATGVTTGDAARAASAQADAVLAFGDARLAAGDVRHGAIVFALGLSSREVMPAAAVYGDALPDIPNQINSGLAFPGIWRGALDCRATAIDDGMLLAAADALAALVHDDLGGVSADLVVPSVLSRDLVPSVAAAVRAAAERSGVARVSAGS